ncbi:unnamed protein product, partial [Candidula unifasciata]
MEQVKPGPTVFSFFPNHFVPNMTSMAANRFRVPVQPHFQFGPAAVFPVVHQSRIPHPMILNHQPPAISVPRKYVPPVAPVTTAAPIPPPLTFSQEEVDMVLYGYTKGRASDRFHGHALSGLKFGHVSH